MEERFSVMYMWREHQETPHYGEGEIIMTTILGTIKDAQSGMGGDGEFDKELLIYINNSIVTLVTMGVSELSGVVVDEETTWPDFVDDRIQVKQQAIAYILKDVRLNFDIPNSTNATNVIRELREEHLFRIQMQDLDEISEA